MKLYDFSGAPNAKRVRVYLAEKGLEVPIVPVNIVKGEHRTDAFRSKNPMASVPVLELDDGRCFSESEAIIEYLEELNPTPSMLGETPEERLLVRQLERICEFGLLQQVARVLQSSHPFFAKRHQQHPSSVENASRALHGTLKVVDGLIGERSFIAGDRPTVADCTAFAAMEFARMMGDPVDLSKRANVERWYDAFSQRPSASA